MVRQAGSGIHLLFLIWIPVLCGCGPDFSKCDATLGKELLVWSGESMDGEALQEGSELSIEFFAQGGMSVKVKSALAGIDGITDVRDLVITINFEGETIGSDSESIVEKVDCTSGGLLELKESIISLSYYDETYLIGQTGTLSVSVKAGEEFTREISVTFGY
tara:strand:- start:348 stop:833 length:486 start_codon:yes stop_codon:yes gene_type:complete